MMKKNTFAVMTLSMVILLFTACDNTDEYPPSLFDWNDTGNPAPVITVLDPATQTYGATGSKNLVTVTGSNFGDDITSTHVYFGSTKGTVLDVTPTQIIVEPPAFFGDSLVVKVDVVGAFDFGYYGTEANPTLYEILSPMSRPGNVESAGNPLALAMDGDGNLFIAYPKLVYKVPADNEDTLINLGALRPTSAPKKMRVAPDQKTFLYPVTTVLFTTNIADDGTVTHGLFNLKKTITDLEFDANDHLYAVGTERIWKIDYSGATLDSTTALLLGGKTITNVREFNSKLYLWGSEDGINTKLWSVTVDAAAGTLGSTFTEELDWTATEYGSNIVNDITFNADGKMYIATTGASLLECDLSTGSISPVYPNLLSGFDIVSMTWGNDDALYINNQSLSDETKKTVYKVKVFEDGAPYHERQ